MTQFIRRLLLLPSHFQTHQSLLIRIYTSLIISKCSDPWAQCMMWTWVHVVSQCANHMNPSHEWVPRCPDLTPLYSLWLVRGWFLGSSRLLFGQESEVRSRRVQGLDLGFTEREPPDVNIETTTALSGSYGTTKRFHIIIFVHYRNKDITNLLI